MLSVIINHIKYARFLAIAVLAILFYNGPTCKTYVSVLHWLYRHMQRRFELQNRIHDYLRKSERHITNASRTFFLILIFFDKDDDIFIAWNELI